ncbi:putative Pumilio like protein [Blattamonas nauphoetae]|uniref:Pumilio like protein n=1 Tax=Blattamonas nauphoetae TaxID=2049346 RepID=A0ABQ9XHN5_9EUKA|nr:putative Pumilio like protein [Blattamonas nauphoetae]
MTNSSFLFDTDLIPGAPNLFDPSHSIDELSSPSAPNYVFDTSHYHSKTVSSHAQSTPHLSAYHTEPEDFELISLSQDLDRESDFFPGLFGTMSNTVDSFGQDDNSLYPRSPVGRHISHPHSHDEVGFFNNFTSSPSKTQHSRFTTGLPSHSYFELSALNPNINDSLLPPDALPRTIDTGEIPSLDDHVFHHAPSEFGHHLSPLQFNHAINHTPSYEHISTSSSFDSHPSFLNPRRHSITMSDNSNLNFTTSSDNDRHSLHPAPSDIYKDATSDIFHTERKDKVVTSPILESPSPSSRTSSVPATSVQPPKMDDKQPPTPHSPSRLLPLSSNSPALLTDTAISPHLISSSNDDPQNRIQPGPKPLDQYKTKNDPLLAIYKDRKMNQSNITFQALKGHVICFCCDSLGSRMVQQLINEGELNDRNRFHENMLNFMQEFDNTLPDLICDHFGNYVIQAMIKTRIPAILEPIIETVQTNLINFSSHLNACRVVQTLIPVLSPTHLETFASILFPHSYECCRHKMANHVLQVLILCCPKRLLDLPTSVLLDHDLPTISEHQYGCRVIETLIFSTEKDDFVKLADAIIAALPLITTNEFGVFVVQCFLGKRTANGLRKRPIPDSLINRMDNDNRELRLARFEKRETVMNWIIPRILLLSQRKFSSILTEEAILCATEKERDEIVQVFIGNAGVSSIQGTPISSMQTGESSETSLISIPKRIHPLINLLDLEYGNFVVQTLVTVANQRQKAEIIKSFIPYLPLIAARAGSYTAQRRIDGVKTQINERKSLKQQKAQHRTIPSIPSSMSLDHSQSHGHEQASELSLMSTDSDDILFSNEQVSGPPQTLLFTPSISSLSLVQSTDHSPRSFNTLMFDTPKQSHRSQVSSNPSSEDRSNSSTSLPYTHPGLHSPSTSSSISFAAHMKEEPKSKLHMSTPPFQHGQVSSPLASSNTTSLETDVAARDDYLTSDAIMSVLDLPTITPTMIKRIGIILSSLNVIPSQGNTYHHRATHSPPASLPAECENDFSQIDLISPYLPTPPSHQTSSPQSPSLTKPSTPRSESSSKLGSMSSSGSLSLQNMYTSLSLYISPTVLHSSSIVEMLSEAFVPAKQYRAREKKMDSRNQIRNSPLMESSKGSPRDSRKLPDDRQKRKPKSKHYSTYTNDEDTSPLGRSATNPAWTSPQLDSQTQREDPDLVQINISRSDSPPLFSYSNLSSAQSSASSVRPQDSTRPAQLPATLQTTDRQMIVFNPSVKNSTTAGSPPSPRTTESHPTILNITLPNYFYLQLAQVPTYTTPTSHLCLMYQPRLCHLI